MTTVDAQTHIKQLCPGLRVLIRPSLDHPGLHDRKNTPSTHSRKNVRTECYTTSKKNVKLPPGISSCRCERTAGFQPPAHNKHHTSTTWPITPQKNLPCLTACYPEQVNDNMAQDELTSQHSTPTCVHVHLNASPESCCRMCHHTNPPLTTKLLKTHNQSVLLAHNSSSNNCSRLR